MAAVEEEGEKQLPIYRHSGLKQEIFLNNLSHVPIKIENFITLVRE